MGDDEGPATDRLATWLETLGLVLDRLAWFVPQDFGHDYSPASLDSLEWVLATQVPDPGAADRRNVEDEPADGRPADTGLADTGWTDTGLTRDGLVNTGLVDSATAYLGEALMRVGGGRWAWDEDPASPTGNLPIVLFDDALGLPPMSPLQLMVQARAAGTGTEFRAALARMRATVSEYQASYPDWEPTKEHTPGIDPVAMDELPPPDPRLGGWLAARALDFPRWAAETGDPREWQFGLETIDGLERLFLDRFGTVEKFSAPASEEFVATAAWVLGESVRRAAPDTVAWRYYPVPPGYADAADYFAQVGNPFVGSPVIGRFPDVELLDPRLLLQTVVEGRHPGWLRGRMDDFLKPAARIGF